MRILLQIVCIFGPEIQTDFPGVKVSIAFYTDNFTELTSLGYNFDETFGNKNYWMRIYS